MSIIYACIYVEGAASEPATWKYRPLLSAGGEAGNGNIIASLRLRDAVQVSSLRRCPYKQNIGVQFFQFFPLGPGLEVGRVEHQVVEREGDLGRALAVSGRLELGDQRARIAAGAVGGLQADLLAGA